VLVEVGGAGGTVFVGGKEITVFVAVGGGNAVSLSSPQAAIVSTPLSSTRSANLCRIIKPSFVLYVSETRHSRNPLN
jgi:hypothetical protein